MDSVKKRISHVLSIPSDRSWMALCFLLFLMNAVLWGPYVVDYLEATDVLEGHNSVNNPEWGQPRFEYSYNNAQEVLTLEISKNPITPRRGSLLFDNESFSQHIQLENYEKNVDTNIWAQPSFIDAILGKTNVLTVIKSRGNKGITEFPIKIGEKVNITENSNDKDNDGVKGIENNETVEIYSADYGRNPELYAYVSITNNTARVYRFGYSSDRKWKPCEKDRTDLCTIPSTYNFNTEE